MKKYFCDVCGSEISGKPEFAPELGNQAAAVCGLEDLCHRCARLSQSLSVSELVLAELRRLAADAGKMPASPKSPVVMGRGAKKKNAILAALNAFRQERGPGAISILADMSGVDEDKIRGMVTCQKVPFVDWRAVGKALGVSDSDTGEGTA